MSRRVRNSRGRFSASPPVDIRSEADIPKLEALIHKGPMTFVLVYADWCGHCQNYKPTWSKFEKTPGRTANIARIQETMLPKSSIKKAKIEGYPSVIKVTPSGEIEEYEVPGSRHTLTNAVPYMRDETQMENELTYPKTINNSAEYYTESADYYNNYNDNNDNKSQGGIQGGIAGQLGGAIKRVFSRLMKKNPKSSFDALTRVFIPQHHKRRRNHTFKSPKRFGLRGSTRKNRN